MGSGFLFYFFAGSGVSLFAGSLLFLFYYRSQPVSFRFDSDRKRIEIQERSGGPGWIDFPYVKGVESRRSGKRGTALALRLRNGDLWDILETRSRKTKIASSEERLRTALKGGIPPGSTGCEGEQPWRLREGDGAILLLWRERGYGSLLFLIALFLTGPLIFLYAAAASLVSPSAATVLAGGLGPALLVLVSYQALLSGMRAHCIRIDTRSLSYGRVPARFMGDALPLETSGAGEDLLPGGRPVLRSLALDRIDRISLPFDHTKGIMNLYVREKGWNETLANTRGRGSWGRRLRAKRALFSVPLTGLTASASLGLRNELERALDSLRGRRR